MPRTMLASFYPPKIVELTVSIHTCGTSPTVLPVASRRVALAKLSYGRVVMNYGRSLSQIIFLTGRVGTSILSRLWCGDHLRNV